MIFAIVIWLMLWGGMFTGLYNLENPALFSNPLALFQGMRALLPMLNLYVCLMWLFAYRKKFPPFLTPLGLFFYYGLTGIVISLLSPEVGRSLYWGILYLSPILTIWVVTLKEESLENLRWLIYINYFATGLIFLSVLFELRRSGYLGHAGLQFYDLPFGLGQMVANGVGRFSLIVGIVCVVRLTYHQERIRFVLIGPLLIAVYILIQTQSRTSLLGLGIVSVLYTMINGIKWQFLFVGPASAWVIWLSGFERRATQRLDKLINLSGRESTWSEAIALIKQSPVLGWGFHSDRIMIKSSHIHNSYIHAMLQSGIMGFILFFGAVLSIWYVIWKRDVLRKIRVVEGIDKPLLLESVLILGFMSSRGFFESTGAFFGVDLLILLPPIVYIFVWSGKEQPGR